METPLERNGDFAGSEVGTPGVHSSAPAVSSPPPAAVVDEETPAASAQCLPVALRGKMTADGYRPENWAWVDHLTKPDDETGRVYSDGTPRRIGRDPTSIPLEVLTASGHGPRETRRIVSALGDEPVAVEDSSGRHPRPSEGLPRAYRRDQPCPWRHQAHPPSCSTPSNRSLRGSENSDEDMSAYIGAADALREAFDCAVLIVHHCGVNDSRPRGHTSLTGAVDAQLAVKREQNGNIIVTVEWMKDGESEGDTIASRLEVVEVCTDEDGEAITLCIVVPAESSHRFDASRQEAERQRSDLCSTCSDAAGAAGLTTEEWNDKARTEGIGVQSARHAL